MIKNNLNTIPACTTPVLKSIATLDLEIASSLGHLINEIVSRERLSDPIMALRFILVKGSDVWEDKYAQADYVKA